MKLNSRLIENFHVLLWLIKDMCWAMEFKLLGSIMILPTLFAAIWILKITKEQDEFWVNLAVLFWILANSTWMLVEFFQMGSKYYCLPFFICGFISFALYSYKLWKNKSNA
jgi:hypothetical protein